jgi:hypothetical protein
MMSPKLLRRLLVKTHVLRTFLALGALFLSGLPHAPAAEAAKPAAETAVSAKAVDLRLALRTLWEGHIFWVRNVVVASHFNNTKEAKAAEEQVVQNAKDISGAVAGFYGKEAGDRLFKLLAGHYGAVKDYMTAAYKGDKKAEEAATDKATKNAGEIASFLSSANPYLPKDTLVSLLTAHYGHHVTQINNVKANDWAADARHWGEMVKQIDGISDALAGALVKQFPKKF